MAKILRFPSKMPKAIISKNTNRTNGNRSTNNGINDIVFCLEKLNDTLKYVTDGLYAISVEVNEVDKRIESIKKLLFMICLLLLT